MTPNIYNLIPSTKDPYDLLEELYWKIVNNSDLGLADPQLQVISDIQAGIVLDEYRKTQDDILDGEVVE